MAASAPDRTALVITTGRRGDGGAVYSSLTFAELETLSNRYANGLSSAGFRRGMRTLVMIRPGFEFIGVIFALFKMGVVPVLIDPGMGARRLLDCVRGVDLDAFVGIPLAHVLRILRRSSFRTVRHVVTVGRRWFWGGATLDNLAKSASDSFTPMDTGIDEVAAILFTSGSTGPAKGVVYEHGMFDAQVRMIQAHYGIQPGEVDLPAFPLFALFSPAMGMTSVIPDMDPSRPAAVDPAKIVEAIHDHNVTNTFGSPAIWTRVARYCVERRIKLPSIKRILIAGAPVPYPVIEKLLTVLGEEADVHTPYGATESLPVSSITGREVLGECRGRTRDGAGTCVGRTLSGMEMRVIRIRDEPIGEWSDDLLVPDGEIGELVVSGPVVTRRYHALPAATAQAKIQDGERLWHRMGDVGYRGEDGRIWFCGRKAHRVVTADGTLFTIPCEAIFNEHPDVYRSALVGVGPAGAQEPVIIVEPEPGRPPQALPCQGGALGGRAAVAFREELLALGRANALTCGIRRILFHRSLPVDVRHNVKINRDALAIWAARQRS